MGEILAGAVHRARNWSAEARGSIHDDATAGKLGFRGGTVAGNVHMDQFVPLLLEAFGERWFETGSLSLGFQNATTDLEAVQAFAERPASAGEQVRVWMKRADADLAVAAGSASLGDFSRSELRTRELRPCDPSELRILARLRPGEPLGKYEHRLDPELVAERLAAARISAPLDWYAGPSPWGGAVAPPSSTVELLWYRPSEALRGRIGKAVGLFGAIEIAHERGPILLGHSYSVRAEVVALGLSPQTEILWFDSSAHDASGRRLASMRMMLRFMKASSPLYQAP